MRQTLHLLILDDECRSAIAAWYGSRWMLPVLEVAERVRAAFVVLQWLAAQGLRGEVVGQWLGRAQTINAAMDWIVVVRTRRLSSVALPAGVGWTPLHRLLSSPALLDYQHWVVKATAPTDDVLIARGPFATTTWPVEVKRWVRDVLGAPCDDPIVPHRISAYELVLECHTKRGRYFLKGLSSERAVEATITMRMHELAPQSFPRTVACATRADGSLWWLMEACPGQELAENVTAALSADVAAAHARVQQRVGSDETVRSLLPALDLSALARWTTEFLGAEGEVSVVERCALAIREASECIERTSVAWTWVACDLDPSNAIVHGRAVRFIDLDDSVVGPAPLAIATLARRIRRIAPESVGHLHHAYERAWQPALVIDERWSKFDRVSRVLECYLGWRRVCLKSERGEIHGFLDHARKLVASKIIKACTASAGVPS